MASNQFVKAIIGSTQSKYTGFAVFLTLLLLCVTILIMETDVPLGKRFLGVFFILLMVLPGILLSLVELTCIVTGTSKGENWWCSLLAWVIAVFTILYCLLVIYTIVNSVFTYKTATKQVSELEDVSKLNKEDANEYAEALLKEEEPVTETVMSEVVEPVMPMEQVVESPPVPSPEPEKVKMESQQLNDDEFYSGDLTSGGYSSYGSLEQANFNLL